MIGCKVTVRCRRLNNGQASAVDVGIDELKTGVFHAQLIVGIEHVHHMQKLPVELPYCRIHGCAQPATVAGLKFGGQEYNLWGFVKRSHAEHHHLASALQVQPLAPDHPKSQSVVYSKDAS